jgi:hypothetical protein
MDISEICGWLCPVVAPLVTCTFVVPLSAQDVPSAGTVVMSTRAERSVTDEPVQVEVLEREAWNESLVTMPNDLATLLVARRASGCSRRMPCLAARASAFGASGGDTHRFSPTDFRSMGARAAHWACSRFRWRTSSKSRSSEVRRLRYMEPLLSGAS